MPPLEGWELNKYRERLRRRAGILLRDPRVRLRFDESDLVEETLERAVRFHDTYRGGASDPERYAWLEKIENHVLVEMYEAQFTKKRDPRREQRLQQALAESSLAWEPEAKQTTPSEIAVRHEDQARMLAALERLPPRERDLVRAIHFEHLTLTDAAARAGVNSVGHASRVYQRALKMLRELLEQPTSDPS
jgi:RNA polymerase sigma factor (sigma-70 family)